MLKLFNENTTKIYDFCSKWAIKMTEQYHWYRFSVIIVSFEQISCDFLRCTVNLVDFERAFPCWGASFVCCCLQQYLTLKVSACSKV